MDAETIDIVLPVALQEVFDEIGPAFTAATGHRFSVALMLNPEVPGHIASGAEWSIALSNPIYIQMVVDAGGCLGGVRALGYSPLSFAMRGEGGDPLENPRDIATFLRGADSIAVTKAGTSGAQFARLVSDLGIAEAIRDKVHLMPGGGPMAALQRGEVAVAALPLTNIATVPGVTPRAICPRGMEVHIDLAFCLHESAHAATRHFADWLVSADMQAKLPRLGVL